MRAWTVRTPGPIESTPLALEERPVPEPEPDEVLLRVLACGVCRTDLHVAEGELPPVRESVTPGHQIVGVIERLGADVRGLSVGQRVGVTWLASACGRCALCVEGKENLCDRATFTGYHVDGGYAEYAVARAAYVFPIPDAIPDLEAAPLLCAGVIGYRALRLANAQRARRLGLVGFGASAHLAIQVARYWGCDVYVFTRGEAHQRFAREMGAVWAGEASDDPGVGLDSAIIFAPAGDLVPQMLDRLARGGTLAINAVYMTPIPSFDYRRLYWEKEIRSVANVTREDAHAFLALAAKIPVRANVQPYAFEDANPALQDLKAGRVEGAAVLRVS
ncbi:MAG TPA: zinc-dependent alcohol dehydrogenase family protein [Dehalococcoidia bacterium]|nr:zinc-dependent alcohol dehydrogenase family protein [Dehalococcoidia bacterium]